MFGWQLWWCPAAAIPTIPPSANVCLVGTAIFPPPIEGGWGGTPQPLSLPLRMPGHCIVLMATVVVLVVMSSALVAIGAVSASLLPLSSLVPCTAVVITVSTWWVDVAVGGSLLILVVVRSSLVVVVELVPPPHLSSSPWVPPHSSSWLCGAPGHCCGYECSCSS